MFKHTEQISNKDRLAQTRALLDFGLAEVCSGIEMIQAAKMANNRALAAGFIRHALDEYRHAQIFNHISTTIAKRYGLVGLDRYLSLNAYDKRYLDRSAFLFEKMSLGQFSIFVHISENHAATHFCKVIEKKNIFNDEEIDQLKSILEDEKRHIKFACASAEIFKTKNPTLYYLYSILERIRLTKRNINDKFSGFYNAVTNILLSFSLLTFRALAKTIHQAYYRKKPGYSLTSAIAHSSEMI